MVNQLVHAIASSTQPGDNLVPLYYISAIVVSVGTAIWALGKWFDKQKQKWAREATHDAHLADELRANTEAAKGNTDAIKHLASRMDNFAVKVEAELNGHDGRISRLEDAMLGLSPYHIGKPRKLDDNPGA